MSRFVFCRRLSLPMGLTLLGLGCTLFLLVAAWNYSLAHERAAFLTDVETAANGLSRRFEALDENIASLATLVNSSLRLDGDQFRIFSEEIFRRHPYVIATGFAPLVNAGEREEFEQTKRDEGFPTFIVSENAQGAYRPAGSRNRYFPLGFLEPFVPARAVILGFDLLSEPCFASQIQAAVDIAQAIPAPSRVDDPFARGYWLFKATYAGKFVPATVAERRGMANGLLALGIDPAGLLDAAKGNLNLALTMEVSSPAGQSAVSLSRTVPLRSGILPAPASFNATISMPVFGKNRQLQASNIENHGTEEQGLSGQICLFQASRTLGWGDISYTMVALAFAVGTVITVLLMVAGKSAMARARVVQERTCEIERQVEEKTAELLRSNQRLKQEMAERRQAEQDKASLEDRLRQAQKMEAIGTMAGGIAHDFNNILTAILGYADLAKNGDEQQRQRDLGEIIKAGHRARDVVRQILTFSRQTAQELFPVSLRSVMDGVLKLLRASIPSSIAIVEDFEAGDAMVLADPTQIHQLLMNLCVNAVHAMQGKGVLEIRLDRTDIGQPLPDDLPELKPGQYARLSVADTGVGMASEVVERIFDPFFTTKGVGEGTGLGLAVVYGIVKGHGGTIQVQSEPGKGTRFHVLFPVLADAAASPAGVACQALPRGRERLLVVDDEPAVAEVEKATLENLGYQVTLASSGAEALSLFRLGPAAFDLVLTDQTMPGMTGDELVRAVKEISPELPIILCTGYSSSMDEGKAHAMGISAFAMKPFSPGELASLIRQVLDAGGDVSP